jgi:hypothetical protein
MSRKIFFGINHLLREICIRAAARGLASPLGALWMNFHRVYPQEQALC